MYGRTGNDDNDNENGMTTIILRKLGIGMIMGMLRIVIVMIVGDWG